MKYRVRAEFDSRENFYGTSCLFTGLSLLHARGVIDLQLRLTTRTSNDLVVPVVHVNDSRTLAFDLYDRADVFSRTALQSCDVYFKRSFDPIAIVSDKVQPFGLAFGCRGAFSGARILSALGARALPARHNLRQLFGCPSSSHYQQQPDVPVEPSILFQTRVWAPTDTSDDVESVNRERVDLVRALRTHFGPRFVGGLIPNDFAQKSFPDALTTQDSHRGRYIALSKRSLIGIYTKGLHRSIAFKMAEYLASSKCIVSCELPHALPKPLSAGTNCLWFSGIDECIRRCEFLLDNPDAAANMRHQNYSYYCDQVEPARHVLNCLDAALAPAAAPARQPSHQLLEAVA